MPRVPQVEIARAPGAPASRTSLGPVAARGITGVVDVAQDFIAKRQLAKDNQTIAERESALAAGLTQIGIELARNPGDPDTMVQRFNAPAKQLSEAAVEGVNRRVAEYLRPRIERRVSAHQISIAKTQFEVESKAAKTEFELVILPDFVRAIALAPNDLAQQMEMRAAQEAIEQASFLYPADRIRLQEGLLAEVDLYEANLIVFADPFEALERLEDPQDFQALDPIKRLELVISATKEADRQTRHSDADTEARFEARSEKLTKSVLVTLDDPDKEFTTEQLRSITPDLTLDHLKAISTKMRQGPIRVITDRTILPLVRDIATSNDPKAVEKLDYMYSGGIISEEDWKESVRIHTNSQNVLFKEYETRLRREILGSDFWALLDGGDKDKRYGMAVKELQDFHESDARDKDYEAKHLELIEAYGSGASSKVSPTKVPVQRLTAEEQLKLTFDEFKVYHAARLEEKAAEESK